MELAQRGKGDTWQVEHLAQDDELELGVEAACIYVCGLCQGRTKKSLMNDSGREFVMTAKISQSWSHSRAHSHQQALQVANSTVVTSRAVWDSYGMCLSLWVLVVCVCVCVGVGGCAHAHGIPRWHYATSQGWLTV